MNKRKILLGSVIVVVLLALIAVLVERTSQRSVTYSESDGGVFGTAQVKLMMGSTGIAPNRMVAPQATPNAYEAADEAQKPGQSDRMVVRTGSFSLVVKDVSGALASITEVAEKSGGFVVHSDTSKYDVAPRGTITIRVPADRFDAGVKDIRALGDVQNASVNGQDVTEQYVDLESRLRNLKAGESQLLELMKRTGSVQDILSVQRELTNIRGQIEQIEGQMKYLRQSVSLATLTVHLSTDPANLPVVGEAQDRWKPIAVAKDALRNLLKVGKSLINALIWFVIFIPVWLIGAAIVWFIIRLVKRYSR